MFRRPVFAAPRTYLLLLLCAAPALQAEEQAGMGALMDMPLADLANMPVTVTSVSKHPEERRQAASAIYVIDQEDIRRSAATTIPEVLRMVPGLEVARIDANKWAITSRGMNHEFANKLLVMVDGRSVYTPMFGGVYWDIQGLPMRDIERIEVIRGPGASLWGANAVNGVINIITRSAAETQGTVVSGYGSNTQQNATVREGLALGGNSYLRLWGRTHHFDSLERPEGAGDDDWYLNKVGARLDSRQGDTHWEADASLYEASMHDTSLFPSLTPPYQAFYDDDINADGGHARVRWDTDFSPDHSVTVQGYYDHSRRERGYADEIRNILDFEAQHNWTIDPSRQWQWGLNFRITHDNLDATSPLAFEDDRTTSRLTSLYGQYTQWVADHRGKWVLGSKLSHTNEAGFNIQPTARFNWNLSDRHLVWASISRAVRTPARYERDSRIDLLAGPDPDGGPLPVLVTFVADDSFEEEKLTAYELGLRDQFTPTLSLDTAFFYNHYQDLLAFKARAPYVETQPQPTHVVLPYEYVNYSQANSYGFESVVDWVATDRWRIELSYSFLHMQLKKSDDPKVLDFVGLDGYSPRHQVKLHSYYNLAPDWELDTQVYYVDDLDALDVEAYTRLDIRLGWNPTPDFQLSLGGKNLLDPRHREFARTLVAVPGEVERSVYVSAAYAF
ncbi:TonB-dependent receptor [Marinobacteraceae bacterium S3BR75-40.1]